MVTEQAMRSMIAKSQPISKDEDFDVQFNRCQMRLFDFEKARQEMSGSYFALKLMLTNEAMYDDEAMEKVTTILVKLDDIGKLINNVDYLTDDIWQRLYNRE